MSKGFLYIASGEEYFKEAEYSAKSLRKQMPNAHISIITNENYFAEIFDDIIKIDFENSKKLDWKQGLSMKILGLQHTPYKKTLFIDTDTFFADNCEEVFEILNYFDITICHSPNDISKVTVNGKKLYGYYPYNTGVLGYVSSEKVLKFLSYWNGLYSSKFEMYTGHQPAFMEALLSFDLKIYVLHPIYNFRIHSFVSLPPLKVKIFHGRPINFKKIDKVVNGKIRHRVWSPLYQNVFFRYRKFNELKKMVRNVIGEERFKKFKSYLLSKKMK